MKLAREAGLLWFGLALAQAYGAQIYAKKMEIVRTPEGQATVFQDSVVITDQETRIQTRSARMYENRGLAVLSDSVEITSPDARIWAESARYFLSERRAELFGHVRVQKESLDIAAPQLIYIAQGKTVDAKAGVELKGRTRPFRLTGQAGHYDLARDVGVVDSEPVLSWAGERDSARVTSLRMVWQERDELALAQGDVRLRSGNSELTCDTVLFFSGPDSGLALGQPRMRDSTSQASGDTMVFFVRDGELERVGIVGHAAGQYRTEGGDLIDVKGQMIRLWLENGDVETIQVSRLETGQLIRQAQPSSRDDRND